MEKYPLVKEFMGQNWPKDTKMAQLEKELKKRKELIVEEQSEWA